MRLLVSDAYGMRENHGVGPAGRMCGACVNLEATAMPRPHPTSPTGAMTTFRCVRAASSASWSVNYPACGRFQEA